MRFATAVRPLQQQPTLHRIGKFFRGIPGFLQAGDFLRRHEFRFRISGGIEVFERKVTQLIQVAHFVQALAGVLGYLPASAYTGLQASEIRMPERHI